jgi:hypothetical protein
MIWLRMLWIAARLTWPHLLRPWRSPLLRWRMETYGLAGDQGQLLHAEEIRPAHFLQFVGRQWRALMRFLRWAARL